jgi:hypothetical protein
VATTDIYLTAAETLAAMAFLFAALEPDATKKRRWTCAMWAAWGLAFLIKGPPALLPLLAMIPWSLMQPRVRRVPLGNPLGLACFAAVALPWYLLMLHRHPNLLEYYVGTEIVGAYRRISATIVRGTRRSRSTGRRCSARAGRLACGRRGLPSHAAAGRAVRAGASFGVRATDGCCSLAGWCCRWSCSASPAANCTCISFRWWRRWR